MEKVKDTIKDTPQSQPCWDREEQVLLVVEYYTNKDDAERLKQSCIFLSNVLRKRAEILGIDIGEKYRNKNGVERQMENLRHCDPANDVGMNGHESKWMTDIINEYNDNPNKILAEAYRILRKYLS